MSTYADTLKQFLDGHPTTQFGFAGAVECTQAAISRYATGKRFPDANTARAIERETSGEVPFSLWQNEFMARSGIAA